jgi:hypothetical protein
MKQTLEEAVNEIGGVHPDWDKITCFRIGFKEGARWQTKQLPWVSVKERLPDENEDIIILCKHGAILTVHIATMYGFAWMVISMIRTKVTQFTLQ